MNFLTLILTFLSLSLTSPGFGSTFCRDAFLEMTNSSAKLSDEQASEFSTALLSQMRLGRPEQHIRLSDSVYMPVETFFPREKLRNKRVFLVHAWDLNRLPEMQSKIDLLVLGTLSSEKVKKVETAIQGTGIRIFSLVFETDKDMSYLADLSGGKQILLPKSCP